MTKDSRVMLQRHFDTALESPDGVKKLRELILTLGMQGKLVKQDPNDQPAGELLKEIQAEKEGLVKAGKLKSEKSLPKIKAGDGPYQIPEKWEWVPLQDLFAIVTDGDHQAPPKSSSGIPFLVIGNVNSGKISFEGCRFVDHDYFKSLHWCKKPCKNDLLYTVTGSYGISIHVQDDKEFCVQRHIAILKSVKSSPISYLENVLKSRHCFDYATFVATGIAQKTVPLSGLRKMSIPLPPLAEQKRIVAKIDQLMALCDKLEEQRKSRDQKRLAVHTSAVNRLLTAAGKKDFAAAWKFITDNFDPLYSVKENVAELKKAILTLAMQGKLVKQDPKDQPAGELLKEIQAEKEKLVKAGKIKKQKDLPEIKAEEIPYEVPVGWVWCRLGEIGIINPRNDADDNTNSGFVPMPMIPEGYSEHHSFEERKWGDIKKGYTHFANGDIGMAKITPCFENAKSCVFSNLPNGIGAGTTELHIFRNSFNTIVPRYLLYYLKNPNFIINTKPKMTGSAGQKRVPTPCFSNEPFPLPPLAEQKRIVAKIDQLMALCSTLEEKIEAATRKQTALFDAVLAGV